MSRHLAVAIAVSPGMTLKHSPWLLIVTLYVFKVNDFPVRQTNSLNQPDPG
jgi:hypothetical protein